MKAEKPTSIDEVASLLVSLAVVVLPLSASSRESPRGYDYIGVPEIEWSPCVGRPHGFECAIAEVPLRHSEESREFYLDESIPGIDIALIRVPASDQANKIGSLFLSPGGPGLSGIEYVINVGRSLYSRQVRSRFDIIGFDPRGTNASTALSCFTSLDHLDALDDLAIYPRDRGEVFSRRHFDRKFTRACQENAGRIIDHMSTADVARDLDILRQAVGDDQLSFSGISYGSYLGITYVNLFPERVRAVIVDAVTDPIARSTGSRFGRRFPVTWRGRSDAASMATLEEFFRLCDLAGVSRCAFAGGAASRFARLLERLAADPAILSQPGTDDWIVDDALLIAFTAGALYNSSHWSDFAGLLLSLEQQATPEIIEENFGALGRSFGRKGDEAELVGQTIEAFPGFLCSDSSNPRNFTAWPRAARIAEERFGYFGQLWTWYSSICAKWPGSNRSRYTGPFGRRTANSVLISNTLFDPATPYEHAQAVAELLPDSHLLTVEGLGHTTLFVSNCASRIASNYLLDGSLPDRDSACRQDRPPFGLSPGEAFGDAAGSFAGHPRVESSDDAFDSSQNDEMEENRAQAMRSMPGPAPTF
jgi:pimeloyl-ACP methyl ester carboxylesterase